MTANWVELRGVVEAQIKEFQELTIRWRQQHRQLQHSQSELHQAARGSVNKQFALARSQLDSVVPAYDQSAQQMDLAAQDCRAWLARIDPDNANGTTMGLPVPVPENIAHGGRDGTNITRVPELIALRFDWLRAGGHTIGRHDKGLTDQQLKDRVHHGRDPMTGTDRDWEHGREHQCGRHATSFISDDAVVFAEMCVGQQRGKSGTAGC